MTAAIAIGVALVGVGALFFVLRGARISARRYSLAETERQLMVDAMNEAYVAIDADGVVTDWNERATKLCGYTREEAIGRPCKDLIVPPEDHEDFDRLIARYLSSEAGAPRLDLRVDRTAVRKDGSRLIVELAAVTLDHRGEVSLHTFMHDITDRKRNEEDAAANAADVTALAEATGALARSTVPAVARDAICAAAAEIAAAEVAILFEPARDGSGLEVVATIGAPGVGELITFEGSDSGAVRAYNDAAPLFIAEVPSDSTVTRAIIHRTGAASALWVPAMSGHRARGVIAVGWMQPKPELSERLGRMMGLVAAEAAVAIERAALLDQLATMARTDDLTGLPNRRAWNEELPRELARARREEQPLAVAIVDLDHFKDFNDRSGHQAGDELLTNAARAWRGALRESDLIARYGGEEFAVALPDCHVGDGGQLIERLRAATPGGESCSAGLVVWDGRETAEDLVGRADEALYAAKQSGRDRTVAA